MTDAPPYRYVVVSTGMRSGVLSTHVGEKNYTFQGDSPATLVAALRKAGVSDRPVRVYPHGNTMYCEFHSFDSYLRGIAVPPVPELPPRPYVQSFLGLEYLGPRPADLPSNFGRRAWS
jgi:hypothetical protein